MKNGFFKSISGRDSSTRLIGFVVIIGALLMAEQVLYWGRNSENLLLVTTAAGTLFITIAGPVLVWMFNQKKTEVKQEINEAN
jgi:hypothetical protein